MSVNEKRRRVRAFGALAVLSAAAVLVTSTIVEARPAAPEAAVPADQPELGLVHTGLAREKNGPCGTLLRVAGTDKCTHGPDAPPSGYRMGVDVAPEPAGLAPAAVDCVGDGTSGQRVQMMYVHPPGTNRFTQYQNSFKQWSSDMATIYRASAAQTGGSRKVRIVHDSSCHAVVVNVEISASAIGSFSGTINALKALGYKRTDRKYALFVDAKVYCGIGEFSGDDRKTASNRSNFGPSFGRSDTSCWGGHTVAHELGHNLGAVNNNAPNASGGAHCTDEYDVMCYSDTPNHPTMRYLCKDSANENRLDCNHNDYFHTSPPANSYLATHYNVADNTFLDRSGVAPSTRPTGAIVAGTGPCVTTGVSLAPCAAGQDWTVTGDGALQTGGLCLDGRNGVVALRGCDSGASQRWLYRADKSLLNVGSGQCLAAGRAAPVVTACRGGADQRWSLPA